MFTKWNRIVLVFVAIVFSAVSAMAVQSAGQKSGDGIWERTDKTQLEQRGIDNVRLPSSYETFRLNKPDEFSGRPAVILALPMPDGSYQRFSVEHSLVVERGLLKNFPELGATYRGYGIDDPTAFVRFDFLPSGFHSMILSSSGTVIVDPYANRGGDDYISYYKNDMPRSSSLECEVKGDDTFDPVTTAREFDVDDCNSPRSNVGHPITHLPTRVGGQQ